MNGRVYDPVLGRFLSADPNVDDARDAQGFNRYSYVGNNPMNATDPSGFFKLKDALKIVAVVAAAYFTAGWAISTWGTTMATSGSLAAGTFTATVTAHSAFGALVGNAVLGGLAGGFASGFAGSLLNGGSVGDAFKAGVIGGALGAFTAYVGAKIGQGVDDWKNGSQEYYNVRPDPLNPGKMLPPEKILDKTSIRGGVRIFENGMLNPLDDAAKNGAYFYKGQEFILAHNPSHGFIADLTEVTLGKLTGTSSLGRDLAGVLGQIDAAQSTLYMHSQGAQIGFNALAEVGRRGGALQGLSLKVYGGATNVLTSNMIAHSVRANITTWTMNAFDAVPNIAGLNALYAPHRFVTSLLASPFLFAGSALSPHSSSTGTGKTFWSIFNSTY